MGSHGEANTGYRVDEIDKRILYYLAQDSRNVDTQAIADEMGVTPSTIRNRITKLEENSIIRGYPADIDYERIGSRITYQFSCTAPFSDRDRLARAALDIPGVVSVRKMITSRANLTITVVGVDTDDTGRIASELADFGIEIEDEGIIDGEYYHPYHPFGPEDAATGPSLTDFLSLTGGAEMVEFTVSDDAAVAGMTIEDAVDEGWVTDDMLVVGIEREGDVLTPKGDTVVQPGDLITLFSKDPLEKDTLEVFGTQHA